MVYEEEVKSPARRFIEKIGKRNLIIIGVVLLIGVAVWLNWILFMNNNDGYDGYENPAGMDNSGGADTTDAGGKADTETPDSYFASAQVNRQRARDEAIEVLQSIVENTAADDATKAAALAEISQIAKDMEAESNIEALITAKGFEQCVAVISGGKINVIVNASELTPSDIAIINEIVYDQSGIKPVDVTIIKK